MSVATPEQLAAAARANTAAVVASMDEPTPPPPPDPLVVAQGLVAERTANLNRLEEERDRLVRANRLSIFGPSMEDTYNADRARRRATEAASLLESAQNQVRNIEAQRREAEYRAQQNLALQRAEAQARAAHPPPTT